MTIDERTRAALARLTENEKACLRRRLLPQTAKEMAIDLGVSPHAVEKRLKMARTKLGLSSSLDAARLLVAVEGYDRTVPRSSDLAARGEPDQTDPDAAPGNRRRIAFVLISGVALMSLIAAALFAFAPVQQRTAPPDPAPGMRKATLEDATAFDAELFESLDRDHSRFLDPREASVLEPRGADRDHRLRTAPPAAERDIVAETKWMAKLDTDRDGKVSRDEYLTYMGPWTLLSGVPVDWKPRR